jgi:hypothetical protein
MYLVLEVKDVSSCGPLRVVPRHQRAPTDVLWDRYGDSRTDEQPCNARRSIAVEYPYEEWLRIVDQ